MMPQPDRALLSSAGVGPEALDRLASVADDVACRLSARPRRLEHSMGVARTCAWIASQHGVDPALAYAVGLLHDWEKARGHEEQLRRAEELGLDFGVPLRQVLPLLHGPIAARDLPARYPWLPPEAWHAIAVHTTACEDQSDRAMALFVADASSRSAGFSPTAPRCARPSSRRSSTASPTSSRAGATSTRGPSRSTMRSSRARRGRVPAAPPV